MFRGIGIVRAALAAAAVVVAVSSAASQASVVFYSTQSAFETAAPGLAMQSIGNNWFEDPLTLTFAPGVFAVGAQAYASTGFSPSFAGSVTEYVYNGATLLGQTTDSELAGGTMYFGVTSTVSITRIRFVWDGNSDGIPFINNIEFASAATIPLPATLPLFATGLGAMRLLRRRKGTG